LFVLPVLVPPVPECLDYLAIYTSGWHSIVKAFQIVGRIHVDVVSVPADHPAKRLLVWTVGRNRGESNEPSRPITANVVWPSRCLSPAAHASIGNIFGQSLSTASHHGI
jgi:hypothetical protein